MMRYTGTSTVLSVPAAELMAEKAAEAMRAKCEEIARGMALKFDVSSYGCQASAEIADEIAALKAKP
jgi:hypothetical protein